MYEVGYFPAPAQIFLCGGIENNFFDIVITTA